jgi:DNA-binding protein HU-beta
MAAFANCDTIIPREGFIMAKAMTKAALVERLAKRAGLTKKDMSAFLDDLATLAYKEAKNGFTLPGIGKLVLANRKARTGRNPQTGATIKIPAKRVVKFRVAKACKDGVLGKK